MQDVAHQRALHPQDVLTRFGLQQVQADSGGGVGLLALELDLHAAGLLGDVADVPTAVEVRDVLPCRRWLRPLSRVGLQPLKVGRLVEGAKVDDGLFPVPLLVVLVHLLAVAELVLPPPGAAVQAVLAQQELLDHLRVHERLQRLAGVPPRPRPVLLLVLLQLLIVHIVLGRCPGRVWIDGLDLYLDRPGAVALAEVPLEHAVLRPQLEALLLDLGQVARLLRRRRVQGLAVDLEFVGLGGAVVCKESIQTVKFRLALQYISHQLKKYFEFEKKKCLPG